MLLSVILKEMQYAGIFRIIDEKHFRYLGLTESDLEHPNCVFLDSDKYLDCIRDSVLMVLTTEELVPNLLDKPFGLCVVEYPRELFFEIHNYLSDKDGYIREPFDTKIGEDCRISSLASIARNNVVIGNNVTIEEFVVIRENTYIGDNTIIRAGCIIGGQGFEFKRSAYGIASVGHAGCVKIGNNVEIQYNTCVDRAVFPWDDTIIGDYCKIDNLVHIAHAVKIDKNVMIVANSGIGGRTVIKENTWIGFAATIKNGIIVGENARANMGSVVTKSIPDNGSVTGNFAIEHSKFMQNMKNHC
ncbi:MAG: UDP-3-O-(3-hydroxymyristoyl)glucosamine N-acyltransferase [Oscillospiraceae bacterium]